MDFNELPNFDLRHTIFALITPPGTSAVAVVRISGKRANFYSLCAYIPKLPDCLNHPRKSLLVDFFKNNSIILDNVLAVYFPSPASFTGEDVLEISFHGNMLIVEQALAMLSCIENFRHALPGEFSFRAFRNGKMDLLELERLSIRLNAKSETMLDFASRLNKVDLNEILMTLRINSMRHRAAIEMLIDFSEDVDEEHTFLEICSTWNNLYHALSKLFRHNTIGKSWFIPQIVLFGQTNAGKSTLFNLLLQEKRSIVSSIPGTTRDYVSQTVNFEGETFELIDTAGIRDSQDIIEQEGMDRSRKLLEDSFFKILVMPPDSKNQDFEGRKFDLLLESFSKETVINEKIGRFNKDSGFEELSFVFKLAKRKLKDAFSGGEEVYLAQKFKNILESLKPYCHTYDSYIKNKYDIAILDQEFRSIETLLQKISADYEVNEVMNYIFSNFCIGK
ncbi:MAG: 50S ribosome-binding GTPase [Bacteriovoracaceae bacterium]|nr:50S ribosome-binding GTPase [Bacteriovoracaceae bacterium]